jgi:hypothetical protein
MEMREDVAAVRSGGLNRLILRARDKMEVAGGVSFCLQVRSVEDVTAVVKYWYVDSVCIRGAREVEDNVMAVLK